MDNIKGVIFDCDGVLFESRKANLAFYNRILENFDYPPVGKNEKERAHLCHTASSARVLNELMAPADVEPALDFARSLDYRDFIPFMFPEPCLVPMLERLSRTRPLAVATNRGKSIIAILEHFNLERFFKVVVNAKDVARPKPEPDMLLLAIERLQLTAEQCLFIGDSELDQAAALRAGIPFAAYGGLLSADLELGSHQQLLDLLGAC